MIKLLKTGLKEKRIMSKKLYLGIDLGGTFIKGGIVESTGNIIVSDKIPTERSQGEKHVCENIAGLCNMLIEKSGLNKADVIGIGIGVPGIIDSANGTVVYHGNFGWENFKIAKMVEAIMEFPVKIANDANVAVLGETKFGSGKEYKNTVMLTLGTGVGGGVMIDGKLFEGNRSAGAELGHSVIVAGGELCGCGRRGCIEAYSSASALIRDTKRAMQRCPESKMWEIGSLDNVTGKTPFDYKDTDEAAKEVVDNYIEMLGVAITNFANTLRPEAIILGGGVCAEGDNLIKPLQEYLDKTVYGGERGPEVDIKVAVLENSAGLLGAAALWM